MSTLVLTLVEDLVQQSYFIWSMWSKGIEHISEILNELSCFDWHLDKLWELCLFVYHFDCISSLILVPIQWKLWPYFFYQINFFISTRHWMMKLIGDFTTVTEMLKFRLLVWELNKHPGRVFCSLVNKYAQTLQHYNYWSSNKVIQGNWHSLLLFISVWLKACIEGSMLRTCLSHKEISFI